MFLAFVCSTYQVFSIILLWFCLGMDGGHVAKKESFQFCFSYKISMNVTLEPRHYSVLEAVLGWTFTLFGALGMGEVRWRVCRAMLDKWLLSAVSL